MIGLPKKINYFIRHIIAIRNKYSDEFFLKKHSSCFFWEYEFTELIFILSIENLILKSSNSFMEPAQASFCLCCISTFWLSFRQTNERIGVTFATAMCTSLAYISVFLEKRYISQYTSVKIPIHGKALTTDRLTRVIFLGFQSLAILRIISELPGLEFCLRSPLYLCTEIH